uniref:Uncharacterized protein n=1 Tax=Oncorhynchus mykiss TaxID=8022 RepID=A0A8K9WUF4_ONCMY
MNIPYNIWNTSCRFLSTYFSQVGITNNNLPSYARLGNANGKLLATICTTTKHYYWLLVLTQYGISIGTSRFEVASSLSNDSSTVNDVGLCAGWIAQPAATALQPINHWSYPEYLQQHDPTTTTSTTLPLPTDMYMVGPSSILTYTHTPLFTNFGESERATNLDVLQCISSSWTAPDFPVLAMRRYPTLPPRHLQVPGHFWGEWPWPSPSDPTGPRRAQWDSDLGNHAQNEQYVFLFVLSFTRSNVLYSPTLISHFHNLQSVSFQMVSRICISLLQVLSYVWAVCHGRRKKRTKVQRGERTFSFYL